MRALLIMGCSAAKDRFSNVPLKLYKGVMYQTLHKHVGDARLEIGILSAEYGLIDTRLVRAPYDRQMDRGRSDEMIARIADFDCAALDVGGVGEVMLAGGELYKRVMRAMLERRRARGVLSTDARVVETAGGIGYQRAQLGAWLRRMAAES